MSVENSEDKANNGLRRPSFTADKNANKIACSQRRPSRINFICGINENVENSERTVEREPSLDSGNEGGTEGAPSQNIGSIVLEETVDYTCKEAFMMNIDPICSDSKLTQVHAANLKDPVTLGDGTALPNMATPRVNNYVPSVQPSNVHGFDKHTFCAAFQFKNFELAEAPDCTSMEVDRTIVQKPPVEDKTLEPMLFINEDTLSLSFPLFPSVFCDEMHMRNDSLISSNNEKPLSTSVLETSAAQSNTSDACSVLPRLSNEIHGICIAASNFLTDEMDCNDLSPPPLVESRTEIQSTGIVDTRHCSPAQAHCSVPDQNVDQCMECDVRKKLTLEAPNNELFGQEVQGKPPQNYEESFSVCSPTTTGTVTSTPLPESKNRTFFISGLGDLSVNVKHASNECELLDPFAQSLKVGDVNLSSKGKNPFVTPTNKPKKQEIITFPKPNFKNIKPKVMTRPLTLSKEMFSAKLSPRSPQSGSAASSPVSSPRAPCWSARLGKRHAVDQDVKADPAMVKPQQQALNNQPLGNQATPSTFYSKHLLSKAPRTVTALKPGRGDTDRASSSNSAGSSASAAACVQRFKVSENKSERPKLPPKPNIMALKQMGAVKNECNGKTEPQLENEVMVKGGAHSNVLEFVVPKLPASIKVPSAAGKIVQKELPLTTRSITAFKVPVAKAKVPPPEHVRRETASKNVVANGALSPRRNNQAVPNGFEPGSPKEKSTAAQALAALTAKSPLIRPLPRSKLPCKEFVLRKAPSLSSVCSSQSGHSACSSRSATGVNSLKNGVRTAATRSKSVSAPPASKALVSKSKVQPLKIVPAGTKTKLVGLYRGAPKSAGPILTSRKAEAKTSSHLGTAVALVARLASVEKSKQKASTKIPCAPAQISPEERKALEFAQCRAKCEKQSGFILYLKQLVATGNQRFEAITVLVQQLVKQREEALKQRRALSQELVSLRGDLVSSSVTCEKLEKEKNELQVAYEGILEKLKDQHRSELEDLEEKLKEYYAGEFQKLQNVFFEEAEKYKAELQGKVDDLNTTHELFRLELDGSHQDAIKQLQEHYERSFSELKTTQEHEKSLLEESLAEKQATLEKSIDELKSENDSLREKLKIEEEKRKITKEKSNQKNPQIMYLEQELESLKVVMEIKNEKLHQQDKKLMQVEKLVDNNATLFEKLKKCQQENEDLKARMDRHMALSRQLSTEQAVLQESLQKESKVNKRLSMENEELLWKLHNGDLCSPKKLSPTSPIPFQSSRSTGSFSSPTVSPR